MAGKTLRNKGCNALLRYRRAYSETARDFTDTDSCLRVGDLLEYELAPRAEREAEIVAWLQERADALSR